MQLLSLFFPKKLIEVKLMQRNNDCDVSGLLFYTYWMAKLEFKNMFKTKFDGVFIKKCIFCGCDKIKSGKKISNYVIQKTSFINFYNRIKDELSGQKGVTKNYIEQIMVDALLALRIGLHKNKYKYEQILIFNEENISFNILKTNKDHSKEKVVVKKILSPFFKLTDQEISNKLKECDNLPLIYNAVSTQFKKNVNDILLIYYTIFDNNDKIIPVNIKKNFKCCMKLYREKAGCVTSLVANKMQEERLNKNIIDNKYDEFYEFASVAIRKVKEKKIFWKR